MKKILSILIISSVFLSSYAQTEAGFLKDAKNNFVKVGLSSAEFKWSPFPPDTIIDNSFEMGESGGAFTSLLTEIKSYWTLEEAAGDAIDSVGTANLSVSGTVTREQAGVIDDCYSFATDGQLDESGTNFQFNSSFSASFWFSTTEDGGDGDVIMSVFSSTNYGWEVWSIGTGTRVIRFRMRWSGGNMYVQGSSDINDGIFHHGAISYNHVDDTMKVWIDGVLEDKAKNTNGTWYHATSALQIGGRQGQYDYEGKLDEIATWNRELTQKEVDSLFSEVQYPFPGQGSGGDSLRMLNNGFDPRIDSVIVNWNYDGDGWPTDEEDGTIKFAFPVADTALYNDTIFPWPGYKDTIVRWTTWSGINDVWTVVPNKDTVLIDSSDIFPPPQDFPGIWDTIFHEDFEQHSAPILYDRALFLADDWNSITFSGIPNWRSGDFRYPQWYADNVKDSIVIDSVTRSKVLRLMYREGIHDGYDGQSGRGGENWTTVLPGAPYTEVYHSVNMMLRPGFMWSGGGKLAGGIMGGTDPGTGVTDPGYGDGFANIIIWGWDQRNDDLAGVPGYYLYHQDMPNTYGEWHAFGDFQPEGEGLTGRYNGDGNWVLPTTDSTWFNITVRYVTNTHTGATPNHDGIIEAYVNGYLVAQVTGLYLITFPDIGNEIWAYYMYQAFGGGGSPLRAEWIYTDDIFIFTYDVSVDVPRGNEASPSGRVLNLPNWPKQVQE